MILVTVLVVKSNQKGGFLKKINNLATKRIEPQYLEGG
jgi:hypothetical protein